MDRTILRVHPLLLEDLERKMNAMRKILLLIPGFVTVFPLLAAKDTKKLSSFPRKVTLELQLCGRCEVSTSAYHIAPYSGSHCGPSVARVSEPHYD